MSPAPPSSFRRSLTHSQSFFGAIFVASVRDLQLQGPSLTQLGLGRHLPQRSSTPAYSKTSAAAASGRMQQERIRSPLPPHIEALRDIVVCIVPYQGRESTRLVVLQ